MKTGFLVLALIFPLSESYAQVSSVRDGIPLDSSVISFSDSLSPRSSVAIHYSIDTSHATLWRAGSTSKPFFSTGQSGTAGIMTDTAASYPARANDWFMLKLTSNFLNPIISFTHKYQTAQGHDGGLVEYSFDSSTWNNVAGGCYPMLATDTFYKLTDTIRGGIPAFSGTSSWKRSRFQFFQGLPVKTTSCFLKWPVFIRFRFVSDSIADTLAGWLIRNITIERDYYNGDVHSTLMHPALDVHPNPSSAGYFYWPELNGENAYAVTITDITGRQVFVGRYARKTDCRKLSPGLYFYLVTNGTQEFAGKLLRQ